MKKIKKFKDEFSKRDSKRIPKRSSKPKKGKLEIYSKRKPKYRQSYINEEE